MMRLESSMVDLVNEYLTFRRRLGYQLTVEGKELLLFARYAGQVGHRGPPTTELAVRWAKSSRTSSPYYRAKRFESVRRFAKYRSLFEPQTEIPPRHLLGPVRCQRRAYVYSPAEIAALLGAAGKMTPVGGRRPRTFVTLFGLLVTTGLRIAEALNLRVGDADLAAGVLTVKQTKFRKSRLVPLHPSTVRALRRYREFLNSADADPPAAPFFPAAPGRPLNYGQARHGFEQLRRVLGWTGTADRRPPRLHDFRHTFAVRNLLRWSAEKGNPERKIYTLSVYLGHAQVTDTYWYLSAVPELFAVVSERFDHFANQERRMDT